MAGVIHVGCMNSDVDWVEEGGGFFWPNLACNLTVLFYGVVTDSHVVIFGGISKWLGVEKVAGTTMISMPIHRK